MNGRKLRLAWAVSGQGRALQAIIEACDGGLIDAELALVVTDRPSLIEDVARQRRIACRRVTSDGGPYHPDLVGFLDEAAVDWMGLTFNRLISEEVISVLSGRVINLHLSLLPLFPGFGPSRRALEAGMRMTGVTVHLVDTGMDTGQIIAQATCPVGRDDTVPELGRRQFEVALPILLQTTRAIAEGQLTCVERRAAWSVPPDIVANAPHHPPVDGDLAAFSADFCGRIAR